MSLRVGLQLYSVRDEMDKDMDKTLAAVKEMGYDCVEFAGYFGKTAEEVKALLDKHGLDCISVHQGYDIFLTEPRESVEYLKAIGAQYCAIPIMRAEKHKGAADYEQTVADIKSVSALLKEAGIRLLYHNHSFEFEKFDGRYKLDWLFEDVGLSALQPEFDTCWVRYAGEDPCDYIKKYGDYVEVVHLKDYNALSTANKANGEDDEFRYAPIGQGVQDIPAILAAAEEVGAKCVIVEQDLSHDIPPLEAARQSRAYLKSIGY